MKCLRQAVTESGTLALDILGIPVNVSKSYSILEWV